MTLPYRPNVGIMLLNEQNRVFMGYRNPEKGTNDFPWQMPQGGIDKGEEVVVAAQRELFEETGIQNVEILGQTEEPFCYDFPPWSDSYQVTYQGQAQYWVLMRYKGDDVKADFEKRRDKEFSDFKWEEIDFVLRQIVPFKKEVYEKMLAYFAPMIK